MARYSVAHPNELLATYEINDIELTKEAFVLPGQGCARIDISPVNYTFEVQAMSADEVPFVLPADFTIGPRADSPEALLKFARLIIASYEAHSSHVNKLVQGVIEGETRALAASITMEQIFKGMKEFKSEFLGKVQLELNQFGLLMYNADVKQLVDVPGHAYVCDLGQKTQMEAANCKLSEASLMPTKKEIGADSHTEYDGSGADILDPKLSEASLMPTKKEIGADSDPEYDGSGVAILAPTYRGPCVEEQSSEIENDIKVQEAASGGGTYCGTCVLEPSKSSEDVLEICDVKVFDGSPMASLVEPPMAAVVEPPFFPDSDAERSVIAGTRTYNDALIAQKVSAKLKGKALCAKIKELCKAATSAALQAKEVGRKAKDVIARANTRIRAGEQPAAFEAAVAEANVAAIQAARKAEREGRKVELQLARVI